MAESSERASGVCVGMAVLPAPCRAGLKGQCVCTALCQSCAKSCLDCSDPASAVAAAKPYSISQQPALALGSADGLVSFLRYFLSEGSAGGLSQSLGFAVPLAAFPKSAGPQTCPTFPIPACPQLLHLACFKGLAHACCDIVCNSLGLIHARWFYWPPRD